MNTLPQFLLGLIDSARHGGRTIRTDAHSSALRTRYPECEVEIMQSDGSLSGFIVVIKMHRDATAYAWVTGTFVVLALMAVTVRHIISTGV